MMLASGRDVYRDAFSKGLMPDPDYSVSDWANARRILPSETTSFPGKWRNDRTPYLVEVMDCLSPTHPCDRVTFMKSAQVAGSEAITNFIGYIIDVAPGPSMVVHPTMDAGKAWSREKLTPNIDENDWGVKVAENKSRDGASTTSFKKFPGGFLVISGANSAAALRQKSIRYLFKDDWDEWPLDVGGQGDPDKMANARQIAFHDSGTAKCFEVSTPTLQSISRITRSYAESDQRVYKVQCPHCTAEQELRFFPLTQEPFKGGLRFNTEPPYMPYYVCEENTSITNCIKPVCDRLDQGNAVCHRQRQGDFFFFGFIADNALLDLRPNQLFNFQCVALCGGDFLRDRMDAISGVSFAIYIESIAPFLSLLVLINAHFSSLSSFSLVFKYRLETRLICFLAASWLSFTTV